MVQTDPPPPPAPPIPAEAAVPVETPSARAVGAEPLESAPEDTDARPENGLVSILDEEDRAALERERDDDSNLPAEEPTLLEQLIEASIPDDFELPEGEVSEPESIQSGIRLELKPQVTKLINYFSGKGLKTFQRTIARGEAYRPMIERVLAEEGVPLELFHLAQAESGFRPTARSWARATGMWQFMSFRGRQYGLRIDKYMDERYDPEKATRAAATHLKDLYIEFGDWYLAMAAYNGGPMRVKRAIENSGSRDYWVHSQRRFLRRETRNYVPIILAMIYMGKNPELYANEKFAPEPVIDYDTVKTDSEIHFDLIADLTGAPAERILELNPALKRSATPPAGYALRLPAGTAERFRREIALIPSGKRLAWRRHETKEGETLAAIASRYGVKTTQLAELNSFSADAVPAGSRLTVPGGAGAIKYYYSYGSAGGLLEPGTGRYKIARGDTLGGISQRFGVSIGELKRWNSLSSSRIRAGRYLIVRPEGVGAPGGTVTAANGRRYMVRRGDTLGAIATRHGTTVSKLRQWNGIRGSRIYPGQSLIVGARPPARASVSSSPSAPQPVRAPSASGNKYRIRRGDNLHSIAAKFGVTVAELTSWNRLRGSRIIAGDSLIVRPEPTAQALNQRPENPASSGSARTGRQVKYTIRRGDTLAAIAAAHGVTVSNLRSWNGLQSDNIQAGDSLVVYAALQPPAPHDTPTSITEAAPAPTKGVSTHRVRRGDTLSTIGQRYGATVEELKTWNRLTGTRITAGDNLYVKKPVSAAGAETHYRVRSGDTLGRIAQRFGVSVSDLMQWNGLRNSRIKAGHYLRVSSPSNAS